MRPFGSSASLVPCGFRRQVREPRRMVERSHVGARMTPRQRADRAGRYGPNRATKYGDTNDNVNGKGRVGTSASLHPFAMPSGSDRYLRIRAVHGLVLAWLEIPPKRSDQRPRCHRPYSHAQRCTSANRRALHDDKARPFQVLHQALGDDRRYESICVVDALAPVVNARRKGSRLFTASLTITRKWDYLPAAWEDDRPWPTRRAPLY